jgi:AMMECR1 domain-containing protein
MSLFMFKHMRLYMRKKIALFFVPVFILLFIFSFTVYGCAKEQIAEVDTAVEAETDQEEVQEEEAVDQGRLIDSRFSEYVESIEVDIDEFLDLTYEDKEYLMDVAYKAVDDYFTGSAGDEESLFLEKYDGIDRKVFIGFGVAGFKKGSYSARKDNLAESIYIATQRTIEDTRYGGGITEDDLDDLKIEIIILGDEKELDEGYEKGIHGIRVEKDGSGATYYSTVAIEGNHNLNTLLAKLCEKAGLGGDCYKYDSVSIYYFPTIHFATTRFSDEITTFYRCNVIDFKPDIDSEKVQDSLDMAEGWMLLNIDEEANFNYEYSPSEGKYSTSNNMIRQLMSSRWLAEKSSGNDVLLQMHKVNLDFILSNWYREDGDYGYIYFDNKSKIGAIGMALRVLVFSPYFEQYRDKAEKLANTIQYLQDEDGSLSAWYIEPEYSYDEEHLLHFYSGEAILSLVELYNKTGDKEYLDSAVKSQDYYVVEYADMIDENYHPAYVPWQTISLCKLYQITGSEEYRDAVFVINDRLIQMQNQDGKPYIDFLGRFYDPDYPEYGVPSSASTSIYIEGLTYAYELAEFDGDYERMYEYKKAILLGVHNLINLQFDGADMYYLSHPERVRGALRYRVDDNRIRIDTTQHTIDALNKVMDIFYK